MSDTTRRSSDHPADRQPAALDVPLIVEQLQDQIDQLLDTVAAQRTMIEQHAARLAALERH